MRFSSFKDEDNLESTMPTYKVILLGASSAGKSRLLMRYIYDTFQEKCPSTYGIDCSYVKRTNARFAYFDTAGQQKYRTILNMYFKGSDAAILAYSVDDKKSFKEMKYYYQRIKEEEPECKLFIIGCKGDLQHHVTMKTVETSYPNVVHYITSAKQGRGVIEAFADIQSQLLKKKKTGRSFIGRPVKAFSQISFRGGKEIKKKDCCT